jgi:hypothetical protein
MISGFAKKVHDTEERLNELPRSWLSFLLRSPAFAQSRQHCQK